jgi:hypothetical protein
MTRLPGVSVRAFQAAISKYQDAIGKERVVTREGVDLYRGRFGSFALSAGRPLRPCMVI